MAASACLRGAHIGLSKGSRQGSKAKKTQRARGVSRNPVASAPANASDDGRRGIGEKAWKWLTGADGAFWSVKSAAKGVPMMAATSAGIGTTVPVVTSAIASFIKLYLLLLFVRVLLTWFPNLNWMGQPWTMLRQVTDPYLNLFRNLIPPLMGQIDFTPIFGFLVLQFLAQILGADDIVPAY